MINSVQTESYVLNLFHILFNFPVFNNNTNIEGGEVISSKINNLFLPVITLSYHIKTLSLENSASPFLV